MMYGSYRTLKGQEEDGLACWSGVESSGDESARLTKKELSLAKDRIRLSDQKREFSKSMYKDARWEHLVDVLSGAANNLNATIGRVFTDTAECSHLVNDNEAVLVLCDWHYGMVAENIWNTYNTDVCRERVKIIVRKAAERIMLHGCRKLHVVVLGDMIHGAIHVGARVASEELVCEQLMHVSELLAQAIEELSCYVPEAVVYVTYGNHARTVQKKDESLHRDNMERIIPWWLSVRLKNNQKITVTPEGEDEFLMFNVCGREFCCTHGDLDTVKSAPRLLSTLVRKKMGRDIDYIILADKHHREGFEELGISAMICGSLCGTDDYANGKRLYSTPEQMLLIVNESEGVDAPYRINCN